MKTMSPRRLQNEGAPGESGMGSRAASAIDDAGPVSLASDRNNHYVEEMGHCVRHPAGNADAGTQACAHIRIEPGVPIEHLVLINQLRTAMNQLYSVAQIREIEQAATAHLPPGTLMQRAGQAAAKAALDLLPVPVGHAKVLVLAGPGNNGGDALETAHRLAQAGVQVTVLLCANPDTQSTDARAALQRAQAGAVRFTDPNLILDSTSSITSTRWTLVIDGLFGIGLTRPISGALHTLIETINTFHCPMLALDVPSGLDSDTGTVVGPHGIAARASHCVTFIGDKPGLHTADGRDYAGKVQVARLEIDGKHFMTSHTYLNDLSLFSRLLHQRRHNTHKGTYGNVAVVGGAHGMTGAPILAARTALHAGAGRVFAAFVDTAPAYDSGQPELMFRQAHDVDFAAVTLIVGPGLGTSHSAFDVLERALHSESALVLDADALNLIAQEPKLQQQLQQRKGSSVLTPHPLEAARLLGISSAAVQADRLSAARRLAQQFLATVVLKGSGTVIAGSHDKAVINTTGNPALATAGAGDVLAGLCGALLAQGWTEWEAALAAAWLHGSAADMLVEQGVGPIGLCASELIPSIRSALNLLVEEYTQRHTAH
jgi:hydroxyethylthiazole kinase-like uncharacterized protein yjeF